MTAYPYVCDMPASSEGRADAEGSCGLPATRAFAWTRVSFQGARLGGSTVARLRCASCPAPAPAASAALAAAGFVEVPLAEFLADEVLRT